jgi:hypothetical protein
VLKLRGGLTISEFAIGDKTELLAKNISANGIHIAVDKGTDGVVLLANTTSQEWLEETIKKLVKIARKDAESKKQSDPVREADYRGIHGYEFQKMIIGNMGPILMVTNKAELGKSILDRHLDSKPDNLLTSQNFRKAWDEPRQPDRDARSSSMLKVFVDLDSLRVAGVASDLLREKAKEFPVELVLGGVLASLTRTPFAVGELRMATARLSADFSVPYEKQWTEKTRAFFVGAESKGYASSLVDCERMMASLNAYRDIADLWNRAGDLFDQKVNDQLAQADSTLTTLFSGKDFGTEILGAIEPQIQLVSSEQSFEDSLKPSIPLPSFGLVAKLKNPMMQKSLKRTFQSFIGFLNVAGAMAGNPQLDLESETTDGKQIYSATYLQDSDKKYENGLPLLFNFSPTLAFDEDLIMITSTRGLARQLTSKSPSRAAASSSQNNTVVDLDMKLVKRAFEANRPQMVSQNMLEKGHTKSEAEMEVDSLLQLLSLTSRVSGTLHFNEAVQMAIDIDLNQDR